MYLAKNVWKAPGCRKDVMKAVVRTNYCRAVTLLGAAAVLIALLTQAAQASSPPPLTIPSGTEVIAHEDWDTSTNVNTIKLLDPATGKNEVISDSELDPYPSMPKISRDGKKVAFSSTTNGSQADDNRIVVIPSNGGERIEIPASNSVLFDLSPDGSKVVYQGYDYNREAYKLFTAPVENNAQPTEIPLPIGSLGGSEGTFWDVSEPIFNKDNTKVLFTGTKNMGTSSTEGATQTYSVNVDGSGLAQLSNLTDSSSGYYPTGMELSPDGSHILYSGFETRGEQGYVSIFKLPVDGGTPTLVLSPPDTDNITFHSYGYPRYNSDGSKFSYLDQTYGWSPEQGHYDVYKASADGSNREILVADYSPSVSYGPSGNFDWGRIHYGDGSTGGVDTTAPDTIMGSTKPANPTNITSASFSFSSSESNSTFQCKLDNGTYESCSSTKQYTGLAQGSHTFSVKAIDQAGNEDETPASYTWTVDTTPPKVNTLNATSVTSTGVPLRNTNFKATFSEKMNTTTLSTATFKLFKCSSTTSTTCTTQITDAPVAPSADGLSATLNPFGSKSTLLQSKTRYKVVVTTSAEDLAGNALDQDSATTGSQQKVGYFTTGSS